MLLGSSGDDDAAVALELSSAAIHIHNVNTFRPVSLCSGEGFLWGASIFGPSCEHSAVSDAVGVVGRPRDRCGRPTLHQGDMVKQ